MKHLIFIVAYNHENFITKVLERLPKSLKNEDYEILIIDDGINFLDLVDWRLTKEGYLVFTAHNGLNGWDKANKLVPDII